MVIGTAGPKLPRDGNDPFIALTRSAVSDEQAAVQLYIAMRQRSTDAYGADITGPDADERIDLLGRQTREAAESAASVVLPHGPSSPGPQRTGGKLTDDAHGGNVVLVHGGFVDGSGWQGAYDALAADDYDVAVGQNPTLSLEGDVAATQQALTR
ncbi:hypothetical protein [Streptomyces sp. NBC_01214]|uniref:hypothetical protein n=1 Tax=Streptomyces sp. NBC_01214 TaxID=2903777 RepID=UPI002B1D7218|nr:hypothetical protein [Streptomyces sp. NBC_01214]